MSQPASKRNPPKRSPKLDALTARVEDLEEKLKEMHKTIYGLYGLQETVNRLNTGDHN